MLAQCQFNCGDTNMRDEALRSWDHNRQSVRNYWAADAAKNGGDEMTKGEKNSYLHSLNNQPL